VASDFQIQEMVHQDENGVLFQALNRQTGHLVALRRFFLPEVVMERLKETEENGRMVYENKLDWLKALEVSNLQKVVGGGFDDLDKTPYFVTEWIEGTSLEEGHEKGIFAEGEGDLFVKQARGVLSALPAEVRSAVCLKEDEILVARDESGNLKTWFLLSPRDYFGAAGREVPKDGEREDQLTELVARFPNESPTVGLALATGASPAAATTVTPAPALKSAQKSGGGGILWGSLAALAVLLGIGSWLLLSKPEESGFGTVSEEVTSEEVTSREEGKSPASQEPESEKVANQEMHEEVHEEPKEVAETMVPEPRESPEESVAEDETKDESASAVAEAKVEVEVEVEEKPELKRTLSQGAYAPEDLDGVTAREGEEIVLEGKVVEATQSNSGKTWYLEFGNRRKQAMVSFRKWRSEAEVKREDWEAFEGKKVFVRGTVKVHKGPMPRGSGVMVEVKTLEEVKLTPEEPEEKIYRYSDLDELRTLSMGEKVSFEGLLRDSKVRGSHMYLFFEEGADVVAARFEKGEPSFNTAFGNKLKSLKGERVRLQGTRVSAGSLKWQVVIELAQPSDVNLAPNAP
jgi:hypothetical protein